MSAPATQPRAYSVTEYINAGCAQMQGFDLIGLGIHSMRERAAVHKGALTIDSAPARGTRVAVEIPLAAEPA